MCVCACVVQRTSSARTTRSSHHRLAAGSIAAPLRRADCARAQTELAERASAAGDPIVAGQPDKKRKQVDLNAHDAIARELRAVLAEKGELSHRYPVEWRALHSLPGCKKQRLHFDYNPDEVRNLGLLGCQKPCSVIAALQDGTQLRVWDRVARKEVPVVMYAGDVLVFDGDVVHAGAEYSRQRPRHIRGRQHVCHKHGHG